MKKLVFTTVTITFLFIFNAWIALAEDTPAVDREKKAAAEPLAAELRARVIVVKPVILCNDDGSHPAPHVLPKTLVDQVYTKAGLEFVYLEPVRWNHGQARRGEINLDKIVRDGRRLRIICQDPQVVTLLFVSAVDGRKGPLGRGQQNGNICFITLGPKGAKSDPAMQSFVVAHEVGHCLNLRHAVDDPAVPNDVPNLQGEGAFRERLAVEGLHATQRDTVIRSPLVMDRLRFHSLDEGRKLIGDEAWEPYITAATDDMLRFSIGLKADDPIPQQTETRTRFAQQKYGEKVLEFSDVEKSLLTKLVRRLQKLTGQQWPCVSRLPWHFVKVDSSFCNGMAHTRGMSIFLSQKYLERIASNESYGLKLLLHEKLHVIQRVNVGRFDSLYEDYGFQQIKLVDGELQRLNAAQNPDALNVDWAIQCGDSLSLLITILTHGTGGNIEFSTEYRKLRKQSDGRYTIGAAIKKDDAFEEWRDSFPFRVGHDHPNEVSAYLSGVLLESDYLKVENTKLAESQKNRIDQTRRGFRRVMRVE
jgi:hypothetical protein